MAKANDTWRVLPHGPLQKLSERVWRAEGALPNMPLRRVMTIVKRADGGLVIHNAVPLDDASMKEIEAFGDVRFLIVPNGYHRLDAKVFLARYPAAKVLCPRGARSKVEEVVPVAGSYEDFPADEAVSLETLDGTRAFEGVVRVRDAAGTTLILNDAVFNMPHLPGIQGVVLEYLTASSGGPKLSRVARLFLIKDKQAFRAHLERLAGISDLARVIVSHHETIERDPGRVLREVARTI
jgi:hypothetical protein